MKNNVEVDIELMLDESGIEHFRSGDLEDSSEAYLRSITVGKITTND